MTRLLLMLAVLTLPTAAVAGTCGSTADDLPDDYAALVEGETLLDSGDPAAAIAALERAESVAAGPASRRRLLLLGRARIESGDLAGGKSDLNTLLGAIGAPGRRPEVCDADPADARWWLAEGAVRRGEPEAAVPVWIRIWTANPTSPLAKEAADKLAAAGVTVPDAASEVGRKRVLERASTLATMNLHKDALALLELLPDDGTEAHRRTMARALFRARRYTDAVDTFGALANPTVQDRFDRALAASRTGDYTTAAVLYRALVQDRATERKVDPLVDKASFKLGYLAYDSGALAQAEVEFAAHLQRYPKSRHADEALWFMGWGAVRQGHLDHAQTLLGQLVRDRPKSSLAAGARYWRARIAGLRGDAEEERAGYEEVLRESPDSGYAWFAAGRLGRTWDAPPAPAAADPLAALSEDENVDRGLALTRAGLLSWARPEFAAASRRAKAGGRSSALALSTLLAESGAWKQSRALATPFCGAAVSREDIAALRLCWPRPGAGTVDAASAAAGLPPSLPFAIMRNESGFDPWITSSAGARGLMQLMPNLADDLYEELHPGADFDADDLFDPDTNVELGTAELAGLRRSLADTAADPVLPLVIASYNGGESAVRRWLREQPTPLEVDRFAEDISYGETRRYVRRVLGTLQVYRYVYGDQPSSASHADR